MVVVSLLAPQLLDFVSKGIFRLTNGDLVFTFGVLKFTPATRVLAIALRKKRGEVSQWPSMGIHVLCNEMKSSESG